MSKREVTDFTPHVAEDIPKDVGAAAISYAVAQGARSAARRLPKMEMPVAGGVAPPIPRLDLSTKLVEEGAPRPISSYAQPAPAAVPFSGGIVSQTDAPATALPVDLDLRPSDLLPDVARNDPTFLQGMSAQYASAQPHLAAKYGVVRDGKHYAPQLLRRQPPGGGQQGLSAETLRGLNAIAAASAGARAEEPAPAPAEAPLPGPAAERLEAEVRSAIDNADEFQLQKWRELLQHDDLNNETQRKIIEERLQPLSLEPLIRHGYVEQLVPIIPKQFEVLYRSSDMEIDLALKRLIGGETQSLHVSETYFLDKYVFYGLVAALVRINNVVLPSHLDSQGDFNDELFLAKVKKVSRLPLHMVASLGAHLVWFEQRVRRLFRMESLGNG